MTSPSKSIDGVKYMLATRVSKHKWHMLKSPLILDTMADQISGQFITTMSYNQALSDKKIQPMTFAIIKLSVNASKADRKGILAEMNLHENVEDLSPVCVYGVLNREAIMDARSILHDKLIELKCPCMSTKLVNLNISHNKGMFVSIQGSRETSESNILYSVTLPYFTCPA